MSKLTANDWKQAEQMFIKQDATFQSIADKYGIAKTSVFEKAKKLQWSEKREIYQNKTEKLTEKKVRKSIIKNIMETNKTDEKTEHETEQKIDQLDDDILIDLWAKFDLKCLNIVNKALDLCNDDLDTLAQFKKDFDNLDPELKTRLQKHTTMELNQLSSAIEKYQRIGKNAVGEKMNNTENNSTIEFSIIGRDAKTD
jgi:predicted DNA-binding protein YlxM (UPF0122 family)